MKIIALLSLVYSQIFLLSCLPTPRFRTPYVIPHGYHQWGTSFAMYDRNINDSPYNNADIPLVSIDHRFGVLPKYDIGIKMVGIPMIWGGLHVDIKRQILDDPFKLSVDLEIFGMGKIEEGPYLPPSLLLGIEPNLTLGYKNFYLGLALSARKVPDVGQSFWGLSDFEEKNLQVSPKVFLGYVSIKKIKIQPEISYDAGYSTLIFGVAVIHTFNPTKISYN